MNNAGFLCERIDHDSFTGDILAQIKKKIETAAIVIAELTGSKKLEEPLTKELQDLKTQGIL